MAGRLEGKIAMVTGSGAGIGQGVALRFAAEGATVYGCDINPERAEETMRLAADAGHPIDSVHPIDLTKPEDVARWVDVVRQAHGRAHALVNAGAIEPRMAPTPDMDFETQWRPTIQGELDVVFLPCHATWPLLLAAGDASIINFASVNSFRGSRQLSMLAHCAGKGGVLAMTRQLAIEGGAGGIRANSIAPGLIQTAATAAAATTAGPISEAIVARTLLGRLGVPDDVAWCAVYLASDEARWVTGASFSIDGGVTAV